MPYKLIADQVIRSWMNHGLVLTSKEEGYEIFYRRENSTQCEKCGKKYKNTKDREMDHAHIIDNKWGHFRNILCTSCNAKRRIINSNNTSGYSGISKEICNRYKQGYFWKFRVSIDGKEIAIKCSIDKEFLIKFAIQWKIDNNYDD